jgi:hypothetical protein
LRDKQNMKNVLEFSPENSLFWVSMRLLTWLPLSLPRRFTRKYVVIVVCFIFHGSFCYWRWKICYWVVFVKVAVEYRGVGDMRDVEYKGEDLNRKTVGTCSLNSKHETWKKLKKNTEFLQKLSKNVQVYWVKLRGKHIK